MSLNLGILLALGCAFASQLGFLYKHRGANAAPTVDLRHPLRSGRALFASPWFAVGMGISLGAWVLHVAALSVAPLSVVQAVLSTGVVILAVLAQLVFGVRVARRQWIGVGMTAGGLMLLILTLPNAVQDHHRYSLTGMIAFESVLLAVGLLLISGPRMGAPDHHHGVMLGAASGVLVGVSGVAVKALTGVGSLQAIATSPWLVLVVVAGVLGFYASARGLQEGEAVPVIAATSTAANVVGILGGIIVFGDPMPGDPLGIAAQVVAFTLVALAALLTPGRMGTAPAPARA
jgi:hypothetical protein